MTITKKAGIREVRRDSRRSKTRIVSIAVEIVREHGLTDWTVDKVAERVGCAKGLVLYYYPSKDALLKAVTEAVRGARAETRGTALEHRGTEALDTLWTALVKEALGGDYALWLALLANRETRSLAADAPADPSRLTALAARAFDLEPGPPELLTLPAVLDGLSLQLLGGTPPDQVRETYDHFWLDLLGRTQ